MGNKKRVFVTREDKFPLFGVESPYFEVSKKIYNTNYNKHNAIISNMLYNRKRFLLDLGIKHIALMYGAILNCDENAISEIYRSFAPCVAQDIPFSVELTIDCIDSRYIIDRAHLTGIDISEFLYNALLQRDINVDIITNKSIQQDLIKTTLISADIFTFLLLKISIESISIYRPAYTDSELQIEEGEKLFEAYDKLNAIISNLKILPQSK